MVKYSEVVGKGIFSDDVLACVPSTCSSCGQELEFSDNFVNICCPSRICPAKIGTRLFAMCKKMQEIGMGIPVGFGEGTCAKLAELCNLHSPGEVAKVVTERNNAEYTNLDIVAWEAKRDTMSELLKSPIELWQYVMLLNIPNIASIAKVLFDGFDTPESFYKELGAGMGAVSKVASKLGLSINNENGVLAVNVYNTLVEYKEEIECWYKYFNIIKVPTADEVGGEIYQFNVCATGTPSGYSTKAEFFTKLKKYETPRFKINKVDSVTKKTHAVVADPDSDSDKAVKARNMNSKAGKQVLFIGTPEEVIAFIQDIASKISIKE